MTFTCICPKSSSQIAGGLSTFTEGKDVRLITTWLTEFRAFLGDSINKEIPGYRASKRELLAKITDYQFSVLVFDVYECLIARQEASRDGYEALSFLPFYEDFSPERNRARQRICEMSERSVKRLISDVYFELSRRCPERESNCNITQRLKLWVNFVMCNVLS